MFVAFVVWELYASPKGWQIFGHDAPKMLVSNWLFLLGLVSAVTGWIVSAYITLRNSIKQHTINTLLQSRLSATYMEHAKHINKTLFAPDASPEPVSVEHMHDPLNAEDKRCVDYVLNYMEFMAVGIRHGDLDQKVLKHTMRGIVVRLYEKTSLYIKHLRKDDGTTVGMPAQFEHITWLYHLWKKK